MKPICVPCRRFFRPKQTGLPFIEGMPKGGIPKAGNAEPDKWRPYKLWMGDLWECPDCHAEVIVGVAHNPVAEHFEEHFASAVAERGAVLQINDC